MCGLHLFVIMCDIRKVLKLAQKSIALLDDYVDEVTFEVLSEKLPEAKLIICSNNRIMAQLRNVCRRKTFHGKLEFFEGYRFCGRYVLIDEKILFLLSRSLRNNAKRNFYYIRIHDFDQISKVRRLVEECVRKTRNLCRHF